MKKLLIAATAALALSSLSASAYYQDPIAVKVDNGENNVGIGIGLSFSLGGKSAKPGVSIGVKAFSQRRSDSVAASVGVDYNFASKSLRPNLGVAYLAEHEYIDFNYGYHFGEQSWGFGLGLGYAKTARDSIIYIDEPG